MFINISLQGTNGHAIFLLRTSVIMKELNSKGGRGLDANFEPSLNDEVSKSHSDAVKEVGTSIQNTFATLTMKLERLGCINAKDILRAVKVFEGCTENITSKDYQKLLQMSVRMVEEEYRSSASHVQRVWKLTDGRGKCLYMEG